MRKPLIRTALTLLALTAPALAAAGPGHGRGHGHGHGPPTSVPTQVPPSHARGGPAYGHGSVAPAGIQVHNPTLEPAKLLVDGQLLGLVAPGATQTFSALPGFRRVVLVGGGEARGYELVNTGARLRSGQVTPYTVPALTGQLVLHNRGDAPLWVTVTRAASYGRHGARQAGQPLADGVWLLPGARQVLDVPVGAAEVTGHLYTRRGLIPMTQDLETIEVGQRSRTRLGWSVHGGHHGAGPVASRGGQGWYGRR